MEWLQKILSNAVYAADGKLDVKATMKKVNEEAPKHIIPKEQYNGKVKELETANETIGDLKKNNAGNEELQKTIKQMKGLKESYKDLFNPVLSGRNPANPDGGSSGTTAFDTLVQNADNMTAEEVAAQFAAMAKE